MHNFMRKYVFNLKTTVFLFIFYYTLMSFLTNKNLMLIKHVELITNSNSRIISIVMSIILAGITGTILLLLYSFINFINLKINRKEDRNKYKNFFLASLFSKYCIQIILIIFELIFKINIQTILFAFLTCTLVVIFQYIFYKKKYIEISNSKYLYIAILVIISII